MVFEIRHLISWKKKIYILYYIILNLNFRIQAKSDFMRKKIETLHSGVQIHFVLWFCFVFLCLVYHMLPVFLDCPVLIAPSVFSSVFYLYFLNLILHIMSGYRILHKPDTDLIIILYIVLLLPVYVNVKVPINVQFNTKTRG